MMSNVVLRIVEGRGVGDGILYTSEARRLRLRPKAEGDLVSRNLGEVREDSRLVQAEEHKGRH